ncbi:MAG TPA: glycosyltransferase family 39 protein [Solirubrobacteraceae bacterium]
MSSSIAGGRGASAPGLARMASAARRAADRPVLVVGVLFALSAALAAYFATQITSFEPDAIGYTHIAIALGDRPTLVTGQFGGHDRLNQLYSLTIAPFYRLFGNVTAYHLAHWWNALAMGSTVVPVYLLAREVLARRSAAYLAAALAAIVPWLTLSSSELTEVIAYPACAWSLYAMQRALVRPSWRADALVIVSVAVATFGRLQLAILGPVFVVTVVVHELGWALTTGAIDSGRREALRVARRRLQRDHVLLVVAAALALVAVAALVATGRLQRLLGFYGNTLDGQLIPTGMWRNAQANLTFLTWGIGVLPMVLTVGLVLTCAIAAPARRVHAFACLAGLTLAVILITVARIDAIFIGAVVQERYVMFVVPLLAVGLLAGLAETPRPALTLLLGGVVVVALVATTDYQMVPSSFWFLVSPGMTWFFEVIAPRLGEVAGALGDDAMSRFAAGGYAIALGCALVAAAFVVARRRRALVVVTAVGAAIMLCGAGTVYSFNRVVNGSAAYRGLGTGRVAGNDWIDRAVGRDTPVTLLASQLGQVSDSRDTWLAAEFWNRSVQAAFTLSSPYTTWHPARVVHVTGGGRVLGVGTPAYVVVAARGVPLALAGREVARSPGGALRLLDTGGRPLRATWVLHGLSDDGWLALDRPATLTIPAHRARCAGVRLGLAVPAGSPSGRSLRVRGAGLDRAIAVTPRAARTVALRACGSGPLRLTLAARVPQTAPDLGATIRVVSVSVAGI